MRECLWWIRNHWCYLMHPDPMWPIHGRYVCPKCQRSYPVPWENRASRWGVPLPERQPTQQKAHRLVFATVPAPLRLLPPRVDESATI
jgi:transposase-like protein